MKRLIAFLSILMLVSMASGTAVSITIYGTNKSNADSNVTCYGCNNTIEVQAWNTSYVKNWTYATNNASDVVSFNISNVTGYQVQELKINGTSINAYQAGANGMLNFTYTQTTGNRTYLLAPASKISGYNFTWGWFHGNVIVNDRIGIGVGQPTFALGITGSGADAGIHINNTVSNTDASIYINDAGNMRFRTMGTDRIAFNATSFTYNTGAVFAPVTQYTNRSYAINTVYYNANSTAMFMSVTAYASGSGANGCNYKTGSTNPPTDFVGAQAEVNTHMQSFWVLPGNYFAAFQSTGTCTITFWSVWQ